MSKKTASPNTAASGDPETEPKSAWEEFKEFFLSIGVAVVLALSIKYLLLEVFVIPSGSMEPTLHGRPDGGDRVLCTKWNYVFREPQRWEVFVFKFPYEQEMTRIQREAVTPEEAEKRRRSIADYRGQNFIKRCIGLPGDAIRIARGDIFVRQPDMTWERQVKPDTIQRGMWIPVYADDFSELVVDGSGRPEDLARFWRDSGDDAREVAITPQATLRIAASTAAHLQYRPRIRGGFRADELSDYPYAAVPVDGVRPELTAIPDRYVVRQAVTFDCPHCGNAFRKTVWNTRIAGRCPHCQAYVTEESVRFYDRRSDLPVVGDYSAVGAAIMDDYAEPRQGESNERVIEYNIVTDLRLRCRVRLDPESTFDLELSDGRGPDPAREQSAPRVQRLTARLQGGSSGTASIHWNGGPAPADLRRNVDLSPGVWHEVEFYTVDGVARLFIDGTDAPLLEWNHKAGLGPSAITPATSSGVMLSIRGGGVEIDSLQLDRDVHYFMRESPDPRNPWGPIYQVGLDGYMALGDNCPSSNDSRGWGDVPGSNRRGPAIFTWWPLRRLRWINP